MSQLSNPRQYVSGWSGVKANDLALYLRRTLTPQERLEANRLIECAEIEIGQRCRRPFKFATTFYTETFDLPGRVFYTAAFPINLISEFRVDGELTSFVEGEDYFLYDSYIQFNTRLTGKRRGLKIKYSIRKFWDKDIEQLVLTIAGQTWLNSENAGLGLKEASFAAVREVFDIESHKKQIQDVINRYKKRLV
jgi:hypothetical protein